MLVFEVEGMTCGHCVRRVTQAVQACDAQAQVDIDLRAGEVRVQTAGDAAAMAQRIADEGYRVNAVRSNP